MSCNKDSIISTIIKRFTGSFFSVLGFFFALFIFAGLIGMGFKNSGGSISEMLSIKVHPNKQGIVTPLSKKDPLILEIEIEGAIGETLSQTNTSKMISKILRQPDLYGIASDRIKGVLLKINSPGGSASESDEMYLDLMDYKKQHDIPFHTWVGSMCCSGGYYLAMTTDYISAQPVSIIGSVGVVYGPRFNFSGLMKKYGIDATTLSAGKSKVPFPMFHEMPKSGKAPYADFVVIIDQIYNRFLDLVVNAREQHGLTREMLKGELGANVFSGTDAKKYGYIDAADVRYKDAVEHLAKTAGIEESYQVISFHQQQTALQALGAQTKAKFSFLFGGEKEELPYSLKADFSGYSL